LRGGRVSLPLFNESALLCSAVFLSALSETTFGIPSGETSAVVNMGIVDGGVC
jgi:hypothetical protein